jgi:hypothetical protein
VRRREFLEIAAATLAAGGRGEALSGAADQVVTEQRNAGEAPERRLHRLLYPHQQRRKRFLSVLWRRGEQSKAGSGYGIGLELR